MRKIFFPVLLSLLATAFGCSKSAVSSTEMPVQKIYTTDTLVDSLAIVNFGQYDLGYQFHSSVSGTIVELGAMLPVKDSTYRISLWDVTSHALLITISVTTTDTTGFKYGSTPKIYINAGQEYLVSLNNYNASAGSLPFYLKYKRGSTANVLPFTVGDITIDGNYFIGATTTPTYPSLTTPGIDSYVMSMDIGLAK